MSQSDTGNRLPAVVPRRVASTKKGSLRTFSHEALSVGLHTQLDHLNKKQYPQNSFTSYCPGGMQNYVVVVSCGFFVIGEQCHWLLKALNELWMHYSSGKMADFFGYCLIRYYVGMF